MIPADFTRRLPDRPLRREEVEVLADAFGAVDVFTAGSPTQAIIVQLQFADGIEAFRLRSNGWRPELCEITSCGRPVERDRSHPTRGPLKVCNPHSDEIDDLEAET